MLICCVAERFYAVCVFLLVHWPVAETQGTGPERSYDVRYCPDARPAVQNADVAGGASHPRTRRLSRRVAAGSPGAEGRRASSAGAAGAGRFGHVDPPVAQLPEK